jgi:hypothetical protein
MMGEFFLTLVQSAALQSAQSASVHLSKLLDGGLLEVRSAGRHRYDSLACAEVAHAMEALGAYALAIVRYRRPLEEVEGALPSQAQVYMLNIEAATRSQTGKSGALP